MLSTLAFEQCFNPEEGELDIGGMRYDVISHHTTGSITICRVLKDEREQKLVHAAQHDAASEQTAGKFPLWFPVFCQDASVFQPKNPVVPFERFYFPADDRRKEQIAHGYVSPPPDLPAAVT